MSDGRLENAVRPLVEALLPASVLRRQKQMMDAMTTDGSLRADKVTGTLPLHVLSSIPADIIEVEPNDVSNGESLAVQVADMATDAAGGLNAVSDTASINLTKTSRTISADIIYAGSGGDLGSASTAARSDHEHDALYDQLAATYRTFTHTTTPSTPASGTLIIYSKDDKPWVLDDNGSTWPVGGGQASWVPAYDPAFANVAAAAIAANQGYGYWFRVFDRIPVDRVTVNIGASAGNVDAAVYSSTDGGVNMTRVVSNGGVSSPGTGWQDITFASTVLLPGTDYWMWFAGSSASLTLLRGSNPSATTSARRNRYVTKASAYPLPATISGHSGGTVSYYMEVNNG